MTRSDRYEPEFVIEDFTDDDPMPCPMGCGRTTEDVYGGPCKVCWSEAPRG